MITLLRDSGVCVCPTLMREVSTFVYESRPDFFDDPFFLREDHAADIEAFSAPDFQERNRSRSAQTYKTQLEVAKRNVKTLSDAGIPIAMGTDTGPTARFQGLLRAWRARADGRGGPDAYAGDRRVHL